MWMKKMTSTLIMTMIFKIEIAIENKVIIYYHCSSSLNRFFFFFRGFLFLDFLANFGSLSRET